MCIRDSLQTMNNCSSSYRTQTPESNRLPHQWQSLYRREMCIRDRGIYNIFKLLHVEYVHRFTYRDNPGINKNGIRFMVLMAVSYTHLDVYKRQVFPNGSASIDVNMQNRQSISFQGELDIKEEK